MSAYLPPDPRVHEPVPRARERSILALLHPMDAATLRASGERVWLKGGATIARVGEPLDMVWFPEDAIISVAERHGAHRHADIGLIGGEGLRQGEAGAVISSLDLYPTLAELALGERPGKLDGVSFADHLRGKGEGPREAAVSSWALDVSDAEPGNEKHFAVRSKTHRLIAYADGSRELYDHRSDPWEWNNLLHRSSAREGDEQVADDLARHVPKDPAAEIGGPEDRLDD